MKYIVLEDIRQHLAGLLSRTFADMLLECSLLSLLTENHVSGVVLESYTYNKNMYDEPMQIHWETIPTTEMFNTYRDENRMTDYGAMCIALLLAKYLTNYKSIFSSQKGDGVDFWLSETNDLFDISARLEISGIRKASTTNNIQTRLRIKLQQITKSDGTAKPAFVSIIEFSKPQAIYIKR
jgi:hypothetical protein